MLGLYKSKKWLATLDIITLSMIERATYSMPIPLWRWNVAIGSQAPGLELRCEDYGERFPHSRLKPRSETPRLGTVTRTPTITIPIGEQHGPILQITRVVRCAGTMRVTPLECHSSQA